jgi:acetyl esterase/lipase
VIHGGFWRAPYDLEYFEPACGALTMAGAATWNIEYRRIGSGGGFPATFHDVARAVDHLREFAPRYDLDLSRVVTLGHSGGGQLALWAAARD